MLNRGAAKSRYLKNLACRVKMRRHLQAIKALVCSHLIRQNHQRTEVLILKRLLQGRHLVQPFDHQHLLSSGDQWQWLPIPPPPHLPRVFKSPLLNSKVPVVHQFPYNHHHRYRKFQPQSKTNLSLLPRPPLIRVSSTSSSRELTPMHFLMTSDGLADRRGHFCC
jgi:hypothetical protein